VGHGPQVSWLHPLLLGAAPIPLPRCYLTTRHQQRADRSAWTPCRAACSRGAPLHPRLGMS
jgi:hypothetical protein